ncbi:hypothetical protein PROFUN_08650 [Planoprotostelium fungivorum]|uniref:Poly [ADP-ribose] polymerase n=1 Tax=Planoprotostelium fungivorum TaxID=1890364 RepID=A0A2P6NJ37_9EUKA|nr:hypothetical protein PROFUN_08650 [Planoprotostelium fungivorum]
MGIFDDLLFTFNTKTVYEDQNAREEFIMEEGGKLVKTVNKNLDYLVVGDDLVVTAKTKSAEQMHIKIVKEEWLKECEAQGCLVDDKKYLVGRWEDDDDSNARWWWQADQGWVRYSQALEEELEKAWSTKSDVKIDDQRFVDLKNMYQRRYDDHNKIRPVKREAPKNPPKAKKPKKVVEDDEEEKVPVKKTKKAASDDEEDKVEKKKATSGDDLKEVPGLFDDLIFYIDAPDDAEDEVEKVITVIEGSGGFVSRRFTQKVRRVLCWNAKLSSSLADRHEGAKDVAIDIQWLYDALKQGKCPKNLSDYEVKTVKAIVPKKKEEEEEEEDEPPAKKRKNDGNKVVKKGNCVVDVHYPGASQYHVLEEGNTAYAVMLSLTDIGQNNNKFYVIQLLEADDKKSCVVWTRWGRVGLGGQKDAKTLGKLAAKDLFAKKFRDKTGNDWDGHNGKYEKIPGKYALVEVNYDSDEEQEEQKADKIKRHKPNDHSKAPKSDLEPSVQDLVKLICDVEKMKLAMKEYQIDMKKMPLGKLSKKQLTKGFNILKEIEETLKAGNVKKHKFVDFSNQFYTIIPHDFGMRVPQILEDLQLVKQKREMLEMLVDLEIAGKILSKDDDEENAKENPIDLHYKGLNTEIVSLDSTEKTYKILQKYVRDTHGPTHQTYTLSVTDIFTVAREGQDQYFAPFSKHDNRQLLWHGSRLTNWVGILSQGLRIAPPEAPVTGYMFGKGVYFADIVSKSANYCHTNKQNDTGLLLLCEVALGKTLNKKQAENIVKLPAGYDSCMGVGQYTPDPTDQEELDDGTIVPCGKPKHTGIHDTALLYNEFIVYDTRQIRVRYLIKLRFNYK